MQHGVDTVLVAVRKEYIIKELEEVLTKYWRIRPGAKVRIVDNG
jgi:hypothetical protein